jgi:hypothetical protein
MRPGGWNGEAHHAWLEHIRARDPIRAATTLPATPIPVTVGSIAAMGGAGGQDSMGAITADADFAVNPNFSIAFRGDTPPPVFSSKSA